MRKLEFDIFVQTHLKQVLLFAVCLALAFFAVQAATGITSLYDFSHELDDYYRDGDKEPDAFAEMVLKKLTDVIIFFPVLILVAITLEHETWQGYLVIAVWQIVSLVLVCQMLAKDELTLDDVSQAHPNRAILKRGTFCKVMDDTRDAARNSDDIIFESSEIRYCRTSEAFGIINIFVLLVAIVVASILCIRTHQTPHNHHHGHKHHSNPTNHQAHHSNSSNHHPQNHHGRHSHPHHGHHSHPHSTHHVHPHSAHHLHPHHVRHSPRANRKV